MVCQRMISDHLWQNIEKFWRHVQEGDLPDKKNCLRHRNDLQNYRNYGFRVHRQDIDNFSDLLEKKILKIPESDIEPAPELIQMEVRKDYITGVGKLEDRLIILLDIEKILTLHEMEELIKAANGESQGVNGGA